MVVDIHAHCFPDHLAGKALDQLQQACGYPVYHDGTATGLAASAKKAGIGLSVIQPIATKPSQTVSINRWASQIQEEPLLSFGTLHPEYPGWRDEIRYLKDAGIRGVKMHPEYQQFYVDDARYFPLFDAIFEAGLVVLFHAGGDIGLKPPYHCLPGHLGRLLDAFPNAPIIAAHMGGYEYWDDVEDQLIGRDVYLDTSFSIPSLGGDRALAMMRRHGIGKILFGTDSPWADQATDLAEMKNLGLSPPELEAVLSSNALQLLGLPVEPSQR